MFNLDMSLENEELYPRDELKMSRQGTKRRWHIAIPMTEGVEIIKQRSLDVFLKKGFSKDKRGDSIVLVCFALGWTLGAVLAAAIECFEEVYLENESGRVLLFSHKVPPEQTPDAH